MIDIHCHILPNVDDGPASLADSIEMAREAVRQGITHIIATPHHKSGRYDNEKQHVISAVQDLNLALQEQAIPITIFPGQEIRLYGELIEDYNQGKILTLVNGYKYLLIELPYDHVPRYTNQLLYDVQVAGLIPIIAHPERNSEIINNPDILYSLVKNGVLTQITTSSLTGDFGKKTKKFAEQLIDANLTHFIASDAHNLDRRSYRIEQAMKYLMQEFGDDVVHYFQSNSQQLLKGENTYKQPPERIKKKRLLGIF